MCDKGAHVVLGNPVGILDIFIIEKLQELVEITAVCLPGAHGQPAFVFKIQDEFPGQFFHGFKLTPKQESRRVSS